MKNRVFRAGAFFALLILLLLPAFADSQSLTLYTTVPERAKLSVELHGEGTVQVEDALFSDSGDAALILRDPWQAAFTPGSGCRLKQVLWNGQDVTAQVRGGKLRLSPEAEENTLLVVFSRETEGTNPRTGDAGPVPALLTAGASALCLLLLRKKKQ